MQILLTLLPDSHHETLAFLRTQMAPEVVRGDEGSRIRQQLLQRLVVLARRHQRALWAALVEEEVTLKVDGRVLQLLEALALEKMPHLLLGHVFALSKELTLVFV